MAGERRQFAARRYPQVRVRKPAPGEATRVVAERRSWLKEFWDAKESYDFWKTRCPVAREQAWQRMRHACNRMAKLDAIKPGYALPTLDQVDGFVSPIGVYVEPFQSVPPPRKWERVITTNAGLITVSRHESRLG